MKFCLISDTHQAHWELDIPKCDILIHSGDFTITGASNALLDFNTWISRLKEAGTIKKAVVIPGNHELSLERYNHAKYLLDAIDHLLIHEAAEIDGLKFFGTPYVPIYYNWAFMRSEEDLVWTYKNIPEGLDFLICHGPPLGYVDWDCGRHKGSWALRDAIWTKQPKYVVCGHIHAGRGADIIRHTKFKTETRIFNAASMNENFLIQPPIMLEF